MSVSTGCPVPTATSIAYDQGWLADEFAADGIGIASLQDERGASLRESHFTHDLPTLIREGGNVPALWARSRGAATRLIGLTWVDEYQAILAAPGSSISSPIGLAGQRLALPDRGGSIDFWRAMALRGHHAALAVAGLHPDDVSYVDVPGPNASTRRADGTVEELSADGRMTVRRLFTLSREDFVAPPYPVEVTGADALKAMLGID